MNPKTPSTRVLALTIALAAGQMITASTIQAKTIGQQFQIHAPTIVDYLNEHGFKTVGVLKFRVKKPSQKLSASVGPLNSLLADRLEVGLILANPFDESRQLRIIKDASKQVAEIPDASHLSKEGRAKFFGPKFDLSWGEASAAADAFLTGVVQVHDDNQHATIGILCFNKNGGLMERACDVFDVELDATSLGEMGESFTLRGAFDGGTTVLTFNEKQQQQQTLVRLEAAKVKSKQALFPLVDPAAPLQLQISYDGRPMEIELRDGQAFVPEPNEHQKVEMTIIRRPSVSGQLGVVLKVNGENTLYRQTVRDLDCSKWILSQQHPQTVVKGYQLPGKTTREDFKVFSQAESAKRAMDYGRNVGQIQLTVFAEETVEKPRTIIDDDEEDLIAMLRGVQPTKRPGNLSALKGQLRASGSLALNTRGIIGQGKQAKNTVQVVNFKPNPTPIMSATITYYTP